MKTVVKEPFCYFHQRIILLIAALTDVCQHLINKAWKAILNILKISVCFNLLLWASNLCLHKYTGLHKGSSHGLTGTSEMDLHCNLPASQFLQQKLLWGYSWFSTQLICLAVRFWKSPANPSSAAPWPIWIKAMITGTWRTGEKRNEIFQYAFMMICNSRIPVGTWKDFGFTLLNL